MEGGNPVEPKIYEEAGTPPLRQREEGLQWQFVTTSANIPSQSKPDFILPSKPFLVMEESLLTYTLCYINQILNRRHMSMICSRVNLNDEPSLSTLIPSIVIRGFDGTTKSCIGCQVIWAPMFVTEPTRATPLGVILTNSQRGGRERCFFAEQR